MREQATPTIAVHALLELSELVRQHPLPSRASLDSSPSSNYQGGIDEEEQIPAPHTVTPAEV
jgi:hypothetical protein